MEKRCITCGVLKDENKENFIFRTDTKKFRGTCRVCLAKRQREVYKANNEESISYRTEREKLLAKGFLRCFDCGGIMTLDKFNNHNKGFAGKKTHCKECQKIRKSKCIENNKDTHKNNQKKWQLTRRLRKYGLTLEQYEVIMLKQNNKCRICGDSISMKTVAIDHCHNEGHVRGVLCGTCNSGLGFFKDNTESLKKAIDYLNDNGSLVAVTTGTQN
jgi:hypothetical protein